LKKEEEAKKEAQAKAEAEAKVKVYMPAFYSYACYIYI
jgi:hypothetical protein